MGLKGMSVGVRLDGTIDLDVANEGDEEGWSLSNVSLEEAKFLHAELGRAIARQTERGFPKAPAEEAPGLPALSPPASGP